MLVRLRALPVINEVNSQYMNPLWAEAHLDHILSRILYVLPYSLYCREERLPLAGLYGSECDYAALRISINEDPLPGMGLRMSDCKLRSPEMRPVGQKIAYPCNLSNAEFQDFFTILRD